MKVVMNAIKIWKNKKSQMAYNKKISIFRQFKKSDLTKTINADFTYNDLRKVIFKNDFDAVIMNSNKIPE